MVNFNTSHGDTVRFVQNFDADFKIIASKSIEPIVVQAKDTPYIPAILVIGAIYNGTLQDDFFNNTDTDKPQLAPDITRNDLVNSIKRSLNELEGLQYTILDDPIQAKRSESSFSANIDLVHDLVDMSGFAVADSKMGLTILANNYGDDPDDDQPVDIAQIEMPCDPLIMHLNDIVQLSLATSQDMDHLATSDFLDLRYKNQHVIAM